MDFRKKMFWEGRVVFMGVDDSVDKFAREFTEGVGGAFRKVLGTKKKVDVDVEGTTGVDLVGEGKEATKVMTGEVVGGSTKVELNELKEGVNKNLDRLNEVLTLSNLRNIPFKCAVPSNLNFKPDSYSEELLGKVKSQLGEDFNFSVMKVLWPERDVNEEDLKNVMLKAFVAQSLQQIEVELKKNEPYFSEYTGLGKPEEYSVEFGEGGKVKKVFLVGVGPEYMADKQEKFDALAAQKQVNLNAADAKKIADDELEANAKRDADALAIENSSFGGILKMLGFRHKDPETGLTGFQRIANGDAPFMAFLAGMFGVDSFRKGYDSIKSHLPEQYAKILDDLEEKGNKYLDKEDSEDVENAVKATLMTMDALLDKGGKVKGEGGVELSEVFDAEANASLEIDLTADGLEIVIPKGLEYTVAAATEGFKELDSRDEKKVFKSGVFKFKKLPVGTIFSKGVVVKKSVETDLVS